MKVHYDLKQLSPFKNAVITTGAFDGVHTGHLQIIKRIKEIAQQVAGESVIITFHPHPRKIISSIPGEIKQLTCLDERIQLLEKANIDHFITQLNTRGQVHKSEKVYDRKKEKKRLWKKKKRKSWML